MKYTYAFAAGTLALALAGCSNGTREAQAASTPKTPEPIPVRVATVASRNVGRSIPVTGSLAPDETVTVSAEVAGRVEKIHYDFGQSVRKGAVIAELDTRELILQRDRARAALSQALARIGLDPGQEEATPESTPAIRQAKAQLEEARFKWENAAKLVKTGDISQERYIELEKQYHARDAAYQAARDELRVALANVAALRAEVRLAEKRLGDASVIAPFDGIVDKRLVAPGQYLAANTPIVSLVKTNPLRLRVEIPETASGQVRVGSSLTFTTDAAPGAQFRAVVRELNPSLEPRSRSLTAEARLENSDPRLRPGMFVTVQLALAQNAPATVVPHEAVYQIAGLTKVFTIRDGRAVEHRISPGRDLGGAVEVADEKIRPGDTVATSKLPMLTDGAPVKVLAR